MPSTRSPHRSTTTPSTGCSGEPCAARGRSSTSAAATAPGCSAHSGSTTVCAQSAWTSPERGSTASGTRPGPPGSTPGSSSTTPTPRAGPTPNKFDLVLSVGAAYAFGGLRATLQAAATHLAPGGSVLLGDCFWTHPPDDRELELLGAAPDDYESLADTMASIAGAGWLPLDGHISSQPEWDAYEWSWTGTLTRWAVEHPDDPSAPAVLDAAAAHRDLWLRTSRDTLGFVTVLLTRTPDLAGPDGL